MWEDVYNNKLILNQKLVEPITGNILSNAYENTEFTNELIPYRKKNKSQ